MTPELSDPKTCDMLLLKFQSMKCTGVSYGYKTRFPVSFDRFRGSIVLRTNVQQRFGFGFVVKAPRKIQMRTGRSRKMFHVNVANVQVAAGFESTTETEVSSQENEVLKKRTTVTGFYYPGTVKVPSGLSSCCGQVMKVSALVSIQMSRSESSFEVKVFMERNVVMQCEQFEKCSRSFLSMSVSTRCPVCRN